MLDLESSRKRAEGHTIGEIDRDALAADYLRLQAETLKACHDLAKRGNERALVDAWLNNTRAALKRLEVQR